MVLSNRRKGVAEYCVLALLESRRRYGLELGERLMADGLLASAGTLYPLLARLRSAGWVEPEWIESDAGRPRKYYTLTEAGEIQLRIFRSVWTPLRDAVDRTLGSPE